MNKIILFVSLLLLLVAILIAILSYGKNRKQTETVKQMIDAAIEGKFLESKFDETTLSQLETRLAEYLGGNEIAQGNIANERDKIKTLIADISHQTKTPVANLLLYGELLQEADVSKEAEEYASQIRAQAAKLQFLIDALVKLSRLETGILKVHPEPGNVQGMLENIIKDFTPKAEAKGLKIISRNLCANATFDEKWTREALSNIVDNAIKYTEPVETRVDDERSDRYGNESHDTRTDTRGEIEISVRDFDIFTAIDVRDTGIGVPENEHAEIFGRFYRGRRVQGQDGVGIGLFLAREIITDQGGYIKLKSGEGGSTFSVFIPK